LIAALALRGEAVGIGGVQFLVGAGMGAGIGWMQGRVIRGVIHKSTPWIWSSILGLAAPFLVSDVSKTAGWNIPYSLMVCVVLGGIIAGVWQALILRPHFRSAGWWAPATAAGWTIAARTAYVADSWTRSHSIRGFKGLFVYLGIVAAGGLILGLITGFCLAWMTGGRKTK
jgi:hypothetical protein